MTDKSKNLCLFYKDDYIERLNLIFSPDKFIRLNRNPIKSDLRKYRVQAGKLRDHLSNEDEKLIKPLEGLKRAYGIPKLQYYAPIRELPIGEIFRFFKKFGPPL